MNRKQLEAILKSLHATGDELYMLEKHAKSKEERLAHTISMAMVTIFAKAVTTAIEVTPK